MAGGILDEGAAIHPKLRQLSLKTIIRSEKEEKKNRRLAHISMLTRKLGVFYLCAEQTTLL